jgi:hypothetical protein
MLQVGATVRERVREREREREDNKHFDIWNISYLVFHFFELFFGMHITPFSNPAFPFVLLLLNTLFGS